MPELYSVLQRCPGCMGKGSAGCPLCRYTCWVEPFTAEAWPAQIVTMRTESSEIGPRIEIRHNCKVELQSREEWFKSDRETRMGCDVRMTQSSSIKYGNQIEVDGSPLP